MQPLSEELHSMIIFYSILTHLTKFVNVKILHTSAETAKNKNMGAKMEI